MTSQDMKSPDSHLDVYLNGIRQKFSHLNLELEEARNERDEYKRNYTDQAKELEELRQRVLPGHIVCQHCKSCGSTNDNLNHPSPVSSLTESYFSIDEDGGIYDANLRENYTSNENDAREEFTMSRNTSQSPRSDVSYFPKQPYDSDATYSVDFNHDTKVALKLNLVHILSSTGETHVAFSVDGKYLATASEDGILHIFDGKTGKSLSVMKDLYKSREDDTLAVFKCLSFSPDDKFLATGESLGDVKIWIVSQRRVRNTFHHQSIGVWDLDFSPNGQCIVICGSSTVIIQRLRDGFSRVLHRNHPAFTWSVRFSQDGQYVASGWDRHITISNMRTGDYLAMHAGGHIGAVGALAFTPDGNGLFSGSWDSTVTHWDVSSLNSTYDGQKEDISTQDLTTGSGLRAISHFLGHRKSVYAVSISPDGSWVASGSLDQTVRIWNARTGTLQCILRGRSHVVSVDFSRRGDYLTVGYGDGQVTVWNYTSLETEPE